MGRRAEIREQRYGRARLDLHLSVALKAAAQHAAVDRGLSLGALVAEALELHTDVARRLAELSNDVESRRQDHPNG